MFVAREIGRLSTGAIVVVKIRCHVFVDHGCIPSVYEVLKMAPDKLFHLIRC
jgi:hypothetical protein